MRAEERGGILSWAEVEISREREREGEDGMRQDSKGRALGKESGGGARPGALSRACMYLSLPRNCVI